MRRIATLAGGTALVGAMGVAGWGAARAAVAAIERNPDPFPRDQLAREPEGEEVLIHRPDGTVIRAVVAGEGPTVVLANAYGTPLAEWNIVWDKLLDHGHRVIAFDPRGHGRSTIGSAGIGSESMAADDAAVLEHFDVRDGVLVGHSTGGFIAIRALLDHPELAGRLRGLVLCASWAGRILDGAPQNWLQIPLLQSGVMQQLVRTRTGRVLIGASMGGKHPSPAMIAVGCDMFLQQDHRPLLPILRACHARGSLPAPGRDRGADRGYGGFCGSHHAAEPRPAARRRGARRAAGHRARRRAHTELGGARRAGRCHRIVRERPVA